MDTLYKPRELFKRLREHGIPGSKMWMVRQERKGNFKCRRTPNNKWRVFTENDIEEVISAYLPGGDGKWEATG